MGVHPADYELDPPEASPKPSRSGILLPAVALVFSILALGAVALLYFHGDPAASSQAAQIRSQAQEIRQLKTEIDHDAVAQASRIAAVSARIPDAPDYSKLITCGDLRRMNLTTTTGASIEAGGSIGLSQSSDQLPGHCK